MKSVGVLCKLLISILPLLAYGAGPTAKDYFKSAFELFQSGRCDAAIKLFDNGLALDPKNGQAHYYAGVCREESGDTAEATRHFQRTVEAAPASKEAGLAAVRIEAIAARKVSTSPLATAAPPTRRLSQLGQACSTAMDCEDTLACVNDRCASTVATPSQAAPGNTYWQSWQGNGAGSGCEKSADCAGELLCVQGRCTQGRGSVTQSSSVTEPTRSGSTYWQSWQGRSAGAACEKSADCSGDLLCKDGRCK